MTFTDNPVLGRFVANVSAISRGIDAKDEEIKAQYERIAELERALLECLEYFDDRYDVVDGPEGGQYPNLEMQLGCMIQETLHGPGGF